MKKFYSAFLVAFVLFTSVNVNAQTNVTSSGMSIQGIARDENNAAIANVDQLGLVFTVYYLGTGNSEQPILTRTANVRTDNFGVFSYVLDIDQTIYNQIGTHSAYLKVTQGSVVFSNEKLQAVPYSIFAQNGVPTGAIMPFVGTTAPQGWLLCDGSNIAVNDYTTNLRTLLGTTTTPDLRAMFLRGAGNGNSHTGPTLKTIQQDDIKSHLHGVNINTNTTGAHSHSTGFGNDDYNGSRGNNKNGLEDDIDGENNRTLPTSTDGNHAHNINGNTGNTGGTETRPINYGVNYIIKI
jgi:microcystin-dependent protein